MNEINLMNADRNVYAFIKEAYSCHKADDAFIFYGKRMTFEAFHSLVGKARTFLRDIGAKAGDIITLCLPNIPQNAIVFYAAAAENIIVDIIHPLTPMRQIAESMTETGSRILVICDLNLKREDSSVLGHGCVVVYARISRYMDFAHKVGYAFTKGVLEARKEWYSLDREIVIRESTDDISYCSTQYPCCILHSGGTTSLPKKIELSHKAVNRVVQRKQYYLKDLDLKNKVLYSVLPTFHGFGLCMNLHISMTYGMTQVLITKFKSKEAVKLIKKYKVDFINGVPSIFYALVKRKEFTPKTAGSINRCFVGGDNVSGELIRRFNKAVSGDENNMKLFEGYGMTEVVAVCAVNTPEYYKLGTSGRAIPDVRIEVIQGGVIQPRNTEGELCISGDTLMNGYYHDKEHTDNAVITVDGLRWMKSGDWGFVDEEGFVHFRQRIKHVIMRKGVNIFPSEVEDVINRLPFVEKCCVVGKIRGNENTQTVYAYVKLKDKLMRSDETRKAICEHAEKYLIRFAVPEVVVFTANFPKTAIGKVDVKYFENRND